MVTPETGAFLAQARDWLAAHVPTGPLPSVDTAEGFEWHREWERALASARLSVVSWPAAYGGRDASLLEWLAFEEAYYAAGGPVRVGQNGLFLLAPTLFAHGTQEQRDRLLPPMARADEIWAQAWSEPDAGSDLAAIRSRAVATDGGWLLSGTKTWSSRAAFADRAFGLFRTGTGSDADAADLGGGGGDRHRGLTYLLFGLRDPGVTVRPIRQLGGETGFAEIFLDDVFVPDANVVGAPGDGWRIAMSTASHERGLSLRSPGRFVAAADRLIELWREAGDPADTATAHRVADAWIGARAYQLHTHATAVRLADGGTLGAEASMGKVFWSELDIALHETALDLLGPRAEIRGERWLEGCLFALAGPIYAGTERNPAHGHRRAGAATPPGVGEACGERSPAGLPVFWVSRRVPVGGRVARHARRSGRARRRPVVGRRRSGSRASPLGATRGPRRHRPGRAGEVGRARRQRGRPGNRVRGTRPSRGAGTGSGIARGRSGAALRAVGLSRPRKAGRPLRGMAGRTRHRRPDRDAGRAAVASVRRRGRSSRPGPAGRTGRGLGRAAPVPGIGRWIRPARCPS